MTRERRMAADRHRRARGVTLAETLVTLAITALVLVAAGRAVVRAATAQAVVSEATDASSTARRVLLELAAELESAGPATVRVVEPPGAPQLRWTVWEPAPRTVSWTLEDGTLVRRERSPLAPPDGVPTAVRTLAVRVAAFTVRAWDDGAWTTRWDAERPPRALALGLELAGAPPAETRALLPVEEAP